MGNGKADIITPANNTNKSASPLLPIYGNKDDPQSTLCFAERALAYLRSREIVRLSKMSQSLDNLGHQMLYGADPQALSQTKLTHDSIYDFTANDDQKLPRRISRHLPKMRDTKVSPIFRLVDKGRYGKRNPVHMDRIAFFTGRFLKKRLTCRQTLLSYYAEQRG